MTRTYAGRDMAERVFRQVSGASRAHAACVPDDGLAEYLIERDWTFSDITRRER